MSAARTLSPETLAVLREAVAFRKDAETLRLRQAVRMALAPQGARSHGGLSDPKAINYVMIKPVGDHCNLRCTYCYEGIGPERTGFPVMKHALLEKIIGDVFAQATRPVHFIWHGGEPTLAGLRFFEKAMALQAKLAPPGLPYVNGMQTNGCGLTHDWVQFWTEHGFDMGVSLDGPRDIHDAARVGPSFTGTYDEVIKGLRMIQEAGLDYGVISVVDNRHKDRGGDLIDHISDLGIAHFDILPSYGMKLEGERGPVHPLVLANILDGMVSRWIARGDTALRVLTFDDVIAGWLGTHISTCRVSGSCSGIVAVEANGDVLPCTRPFDRSRFTFGNLALQSLSEIAHGPGLDAFRSADAACQARTKSCEFHAMCHHGCPHQRQRDGVAAIDGNNLYCACANGVGGGYSGLYRRLFDLMDAAAPQLGLPARKDLRPQEPEPA